MSDTRHPSESEKLLQGVVDQSSESQATQSLEPSESDGLAGAERIGPYRILSRLGEGGFGVVYLVEQTAPVIRRVALKVIKPGMDSKAVISRFEQERQALAVMDHPNVARVLDAGTTDRGLPYFAMEFVKGEPITRYCDRYNLTIKQRLELFIPVCEAVQHAHMKGLIHRDIKPSNVLVAVGDSGPIVKVIDFGVAKAISHRFTQQTIFTEQGQLIGTPEYMSPEQAEMGATDIDTRTDVYALGVLLYELLTGATPFDPKMLRAGGFAEIQRMIREVDPPKPSTRFSSLGEQSAEVARHRQAKREDLARELSRELDWIPLKAMRKDRTDRYRNATDLSDDIQRYLNGEALEAGPEAVTYRLRKFINRNRGPTMVGAAFILVLLLGIAGTSWGMYQARLAQVEEADQRQVAEQRIHDMQELFSPFVNEFRLSSQAWASNYLEDLDDYEADVVGWDEVAISAVYAEVARRLYKDDQIKLGYCLGSIAMLLEGMFSRWGSAENRQLGEPLLNEAITLLAHVEDVEPWEVAALHSSLFELLRKDGRGQHAVPILHDGAEAMQRRGAHLLSEVLLQKAVQYLESNFSDLPDQTREKHRSETFQRLANLYDHWHRYDPHGGYDEKAETWRAKLAVVKAEQANRSPKSNDE